MDDLGHGLYSPMDVSLLPPLYIIYAENPSDSGKVCFHFTLSSGVGIGNVIVMICVN